MVPKKELEEFWKELEEKEEDLSFKEMKIEMCSETRHIKVNKSWVAYSNPDAAIVQFVTKRIRNPNKIPLTITPIYDELAFKPGLNQKIELEIKTPKATYDIPCLISFTVCPKIAKKGTEYFEGDFQLRGSQKLIDRARELLETEGAFINKEIKQPDGVDFKVTSKKAMRRVGKQLGKEFVGEFKESPRLFSRDSQTSKEIYRLNCFFREKGEKIGDVVDVNGEKVKITTIGRRVSGKSLETGKKVFIR